MLLPALSRAARSGLKKLLVPTAPFWSGVPVRKTPLQNDLENGVFRAAGVGRFPVRRTVVNNTLRTRASLGARFREFLRWITVKQKQRIPECIHYLTIHYPNELSFRYFNEFIGCLFTKR